MFKDALRVAREGASYVLKQQARTTAPLVAFVDAGRVRCIDAGRTRAVELLARQPDAVAGVYDHAATREQIVEDLLVVVSAWQR